MAQGNIEADKRYYHLASYFDQQDHGETIFREVQRIVIDSQISGFALFVGARYDHEKDFYWHVVVISEEPLYRNLEQRLRLVMSRGSFTDIPEDHIQKLKEKRLKDAGDPAKTNLSLLHHIHPDFYTLS